MAGGYRYGPWDGGADPLAPPFDLGAALDELADGVLEGAGARESLDRLLRRGTQQRRGLDDLRRQVERRRRQARRAGRLDGTLEEVRRLLDTAVGQERAALFPDPSDAARTAEMELDTLPEDTSRAVRALADYEWRSPQARETFESINDLMRREVLDSQFRGMKEALEGATDADRARIADMMADLSALIEADLRGEDTAERFQAFMAKHGDFFPEQPETLSDLIDSLARRAAAAQRLMDSLSPDQRDELAGLMQQALGDMNMQAEMARLQDALRASRPDLDWGGTRSSRRRRRGEQGVDGGRPLGMGEATSVLEELAELDELAASLGQDYPGATLDDIDPDAVARELGREAVDDLRALQQIERELERQGYINRQGGKLELTPRAVRHIGASALARVFRQIEARGRGPHDARDAGAAGELTGSTRPWQFGDEQPLDVVRTVRNALLRGGLPEQGRVRLDVEDFEVKETERRAGAAVMLLVDLSYSMLLRGTWGVAKSTALALHTLVTTKYPQDVLHVIGFSDYARELHPAELAGLDAEMVQGTNLQHALSIAGRLLSRYPGLEPVVLVVTDGEPTAHLLRDGSPRFAWPPLPETLELTMVEVDRLTRRGATINVFMLDDEPRLVDFVEGLAHRNGGRVFATDNDNLGSFVVHDYLSARSGPRTHKR
ncbi:MAG: von Willebrand factor type [Mycobacterium sp.]|jgi:uncharacterized protein with von Willebrand factor type A (vWA) domain|nr:von Willebrand factor type [Mycobacterium sp.]